MLLWRAPPHPGSCWGVVVRPCGRRAAGWTPHQGDPGQPDAHPSRLRLRRPLSHPTHRPWQQIILIFSNNEAKP